MTNFELLDAAYTSSPIVPWNKGRLVGPKLPLKLKEIWGIRVRLQLASRIRALALFNLVGYPPVNAGIPKKLLAGLRSASPSGVTAECSFGQVRDLCVTRKVPIFLLNCFSTLVFSCWFSVIYPHQLTERKSRGIDEHKKRAYVRT